jgi:hypothetical protein
VRGNVPKIGRLPPSHLGIDELEDATYDYLLHHNAKPKPLVWEKYIK